VFDQLSERLQATLSDVRSRGRLGEEDVDRAMREIRLALLEADVNFRVVKSFTAKVRERCLEADLGAGLNPGQQVVKIVNEELANLLGGADRKLVFSDSGPTVVLMAGLQGSGKTTASVKLARLLAGEGRKVALAACDVYRPAAIEQLETLAESVGIPVYQQGDEADPVEVAEWALESAREQGRDVLIVDTAGRLHVDGELMAELEKIRKRVRPHNVLLVVDAMTGQDAVEVAESFSESAGFDGVVISKLDGDARGGAALSVNAVTGKPILFASTGERLEDFEAFHPDRMAGRILGMGDVLSLIEKAEAQVDADQAEELQRKMATEQFTLEDFLEQMRQVRKMGPIGNLLKMMPGMGSAGQLKDVDVDEGELDRLEAMILSMTPEERMRPEMIKGSRRRRIAEGSGTKIQQVNGLVKQFDQMRRLMKQMASGNMPDPRQLARMTGQATRGPTRRR
jgi:signal recognition particle subunit SRP54